MPKYKNIFILLLTLTLLITGCDRPEGTDDDAYFAVDRITGILAIPNDLPETFTLQLKACIRSVHNPETTLPRRKFLISNNKELIQKEGEKNPSEIVTCTGTENQNSNCQSDNSMSKNTPVIALATEGDGCLQWTEEYDYAYTNESKWININRYIQGIDAPWIGRVSIPIAVNPWLQRTQKEEYSELQIADLRHHEDNNLLKDKIHPGDGLEYLKQAKQTEKKHKIDTIVKNVRLIISSKKNTDKPKNKQNGFSKGPQQIVTGKIEIPVQYTIQDITGNPSDNFINTGDFEVDLSMLVEHKVTKEFVYVNSKEESITSSSMDFKTEEGNPNNNVLISNTRFEWVINNKPASSYIYLLLKLSPKPGTDTAKRVKPFIGIYYITANYNNIQNQIFDLELDGALDKRHRANIEHYNDTNKPLYSQGHPKSNFSQCIEEQFNIERCISNKKLDRSQDLVQLIGWDTDLLNMRHNYVTHENWLSRRIKTFISSTLLDISEDRSVPSKSIDSVEIIDFTTGELRRFRVTSPNSQGMFSFDMFTKQQWYKQQRYFLKMVTFQIPNQMYTTKLVSINPWDYTWTHGFDVTIDNEQPTTCLNKTPEEKAALQALFDEQSTDQIKYLISQNIYHSVVEKLFCYNKELQKFYNIDTTDDSTYITLTLPELFLKFKEALSNDITRWINQEKDFLRNELSKKQITQPEYKIKIKNKTHAGYIFDKFKSVAEETLPSMYIHLLRSITTYPEYTLDDSLNRHLKYNMSFKLTPRVVRHEDITRGVQNKGPLRDGIYILQLAVMKNDQERKNGDSAMVSYQPSSSSEIEYVTDGFTNHLYSCNLKQSGCLTIDDFIIPPTNVPVLVREGMVRTKLKLALRQEQILFSDSKNLLIFRLLPVDPTSICPNDTEACMKNYGHYNYLEDVWNPDTLSKIKPITDRDYSNLIIHTYKAPFIMKNWANWTITHELREAFDELSERYFLEKNKNRLSHLHQQINESILNLTASENNNRYENNEQLKESAQLAVKQLEENRKKVNTTKTKIDQRIDELHGKPKIKDYTDALKYVTSTEIIHDPEETATIKNAEEVINDTFDTLKTAYNLESKKTNCNPLLITKSPSEITYQDCRKEESKDQNFDLSDIHIYNFASENALCILNVDSDNSKPEIGMLSKQKTCGLFKTSEAQQNTSSQTNQESFLVNINQQIKNINSRIKGISYGAPIYSPFFQNRDSSDNSPEPLPTLTKIDLEKIIHSGITPYNFTDSKTNSFTKALCGFWFDQFYQDYITPTQLVDSFHSKAKQSLYYQLRNITDHLPPDSEMTEYSRRAVNKLINTFNKEKIQLDSEGLLENYYQWTYNINNSFAHRLNSDLLEVFSGIILQSPFKNFSQKSRSVLFKSKSIGAVNNAPKVHPLHKCLRNPSHFFGFENKIIVGQINKDSKKHIYKSGVPETFRITENFFMNTQRDQGANQGSETSIGTQLALPIGAILIALSAIVPGGVILSVVGAAIITSGLRLQGKVDYTYRSFEGSGARRLISFIVENGLSLKSEQAKINIGLQNYHSCLVIRPRFSAFERDTYTHIWKENSDPVVRSLYEKTGMLLCAKGKKEKTITEDYFYISPNYTEANGNTIDTSSFRNKPFAISLRGKNAYHKFKDSLSCYVTESTKHIPNNQNCRYTKRQFKYLLNRKIEFTDNLKKGFNHPKLFHTTGYIPGVYDYYDKNEWGEIEEDSGSAEKFLKGLSDFQPDLDLTNFLKKAYH